MSHHPSLELYNVRSIFMTILPIISLIGILISVTFGLLLSLRPGSAIEMQKKFYHRINWNIEPVSMAKEIRNTRIMGFILIATAIITTVFVILAVVTH